MNIIRKLDNQIQSMIGIRLKSWYVPQRDKTMWLYTKRKLLIEYVLCPKKIFIKKEFRVKFLIAS